jgi:hypothetical protein
MKFKIAIAFILSFTSLHPSLSAKAAEQEQRNSDSRVVQSIELSTGVARS